MDCYGLEAPLLLFYMMILINFILELNQHMPYYVLLSSDTAVLLCVACYLDTMM